MLPIHHLGDIIAKKYKIVKLLGQGGVGTTYEAENINNAQRVAVKVTSLRQIKDWKILELFEREAKILATLSHSGIPKYLDYFHLDSAEDRYFYLVRELITGESLFDLVEKNGQFEEEEVQQIAIQILDILKYLHQQENPIIHRDIKPQNLIRSKDNKLFLVDFGSVQEVYRKTLSGSSTFVGTLGYMPPEQLRGQTSFASDLYSLGATLLFLLTKKCPDDLPQQRMKIDFRSQVEISDKLANWLDKLLEPIVEERFQSVNQVLEAFYDKNKYFQPVKSRISLTRANNSLKIKIPHCGIQGEILGRNLYFGLISVLILVVVWIGSIIFFLIGFAADSWILETVFFLSFIPFWKVSFTPLGLFLYGLLGYTEIEIDSENFKISKTMFKLGKSTRGKTKNLTKIEQALTSYDMRGEEIFYCTFYEKKQTINFGAMIRLDEQKWLIEEISDFLNQNKKHTKN